MDSDDYDYSPKYDAGEHWNQILEELVSEGWINEDIGHKLQLDCEGQRAVEARVRELLLPATAGR